MKYKSKCDCCKSLLTTSMHRGDYYCCPYCGNRSPLLICNENKKKEGK